MSTRSNKRRIYALIEGRLHGQVVRRSVEEQAWLDMAPVGREFGRPDYERLQILDLHASGQMTAEAALRNLGGDSLEELQRQLRADGL